MFKLSSLQQSVLTQISNLRRRSSGSTPPSCLVYGPPGSGKRTTVHALADALTFDFLQVNVGDTPSCVRQRLFGTRAEAERASDLLRGPGECGTDEAAILYLFGLDNLDQSLHQEIHRLITSRKYVDALGREWRLSDWTWPIAAIDTTDTAPSVVDLVHWICTGFEHQVRIDVCEDEESFHAVCEYIAGEFGCTFESKDDTPILSDIRRTPDGLHALRRWITSASVLETGSKVIQVNMVRKEMLKDIHTILGHLRYRQQVLSPLNFEAWAAQFGKKKSLAFHILRCISSRYYIGGSQYFRAIDHIIERSGIPAQSSVTFCKWQGEGRSAPRIAHEMKNHAQWRIADDREVDLRKTPPLCVGLDPRDAHILIIADDFSGSGQTLVKLFDGPKAPASCLLDTLPRARLFIGVIAGYRKAFQSVITRTAKYGDRVKIVPYTVFDEEDKCFTDCSRIFPDSGEREDFKRFCIDVALRHFRGLRGQHRIGYGGVGSLVVFADTVPNNTLPIVWYDKSGWRPLFPASGLLNQRPTDGLEHL